mmetsp:Transcript_22250/g.44734  ORF Transcript_22250/g.44734 Transcript_22250/m.44734 type:complete len:344 (+) Transcript_22250:4058-5089(+)
MLPRAVQLNCECDYTAETHLLEHLDTPTDRMFPREKVAIFIGQRRLTTDTSRWIRHHIGKQLARQFYMSKKILSGSQFDRVDLVHIADTLQSLPKLFQLWAAKHVSRVAGTMAYLHYQTGCSPLCPSCLSAQETTSHITRCPEAGRQKALEASITNLTSWLTASHTDPLLREAIVSYLQQRGAVSLTELLEGYPRRYWKLGVDQDDLGWDSFTMGMVTKEFQHLQALHLGASECRMSVKQWMHTFIGHLLQATHTQWNYRNEVVHNATSGNKQNTRKQCLQERINTEMARGLEHLQQEDQYLMSVELGDLNNSLCDRHEYWLLAVETARLCGYMDQFPPAGIG